MPQVTYSKVLDASADQVWALVRDFGALAQWFPFVSNCELKDGARPDQVGAVRVNTVAEGALIEETLLELSDRDRRLVYSLTKGDVPTTDYSATLTIHEVSADGRAFAEWSARFDVSGDPAPIVKWVRQDIFQICLDELERVVKQSAR
ncbi:SRPBCC family protein [uncultured Hymenobacter sp.]|uniref:SRPBCC family protein n=1 Tax=uncultured Hymenobacter sp. TaxID=170016 RepID=UPI0035CA0C8E